MSYLAVLALEFREMENTADCNGFLMDQLFVSETAAQSFAPYCFQITATFSNTSIKNFNGGLFVKLSRRNRGGNMPIIYSVLSIFCWDILNIIPSVNQPNWLALKLVASIYKKPKDFLRYMWVNWFIPRRFFFFFLFTKHRCFNSSSGIPCSPRRGSAPKPSLILFTVTCI